jgi:hypothetical protein
VRSIGADEIFAWAESRRDSEAVSVATINRNDLVAVSSVLSWGTKRQSGRLLSSNPAKGVRLDALKIPAPRERTFRENEIKAVLSSAGAVLPSRADATIAYAKRWCPWLAAYSGAVSQN